MARPRRNVERGNRKGCCEAIVAYLRGKKLATEKKPIGSPNGTNQYTKVDNEELPHSEVVAQSGQFKPSAFGEEIGHRTSEKLGKETGPGKTSTADYIKYIDPFVYVHQDPPNMSIRYSSRHFGGFRCAYNYPRDKNHR